MPTNVAYEQDVRSLPVSVKTVLRPVGAHTTDATVDAATALVAPAGATMVRLQCAAQAIRYTLDGTTPTTSTGFLLAVGVEKDIVVGGGASLQVIAAVSGASIQYQWFG